ncbi:hypothetical protein [Roseimarinus sediminis]|uniref:hypothetical protein n=1 Tax=Roseimarinus sediminis TaxID=1610899 RepID=UPI003D1ED26D
MKTKHPLFKEKWYIHFILSGILVFTLFACEQNALSPEARQLVSPNGYVLANDSDELRSLLNISPESKIDAIDYFESKEANLALVTYTDENGKESTIALGSGPISYKAAGVDVRTGVKSPGENTNEICTKKDE